MTTAVCRSIAVRKLPGIHRHFSSTQVQLGSLVGFIGLGNMGAYMATNLINKGHKLIVYDVAPTATFQMKQLGAEIARSPAELAEKSDTIVSMVPNNQHVVDVYAGEDGVFKTVKEGSLLLDCSTVDPSVPKQMAELAQAKGATFMDAPVSGGVIAAKAGTLTFMVGGFEKDFPKTQNVLSGMGRNIVYCGAIGSGQAAKICNNMLLAISMIGTCEAMNLGVRLGLDPKLLSGIVNTSTGRCWSSEIYNPVPGVLDNVPSANDYQGGFRTTLIAKDLGLAQTAAIRSGSVIPLGSLAHQIYRIMSIRGFDDKDFSCVYKFLQEM